jgi:hypothetical protein
LAFLDLGSVTVWKKVLSFAVDELVVIGVGLLIATCLEVD